MELTDYFDGLEWLDQAECRGTEPNLWFPDYDTANNERLPKAICQMCSVRIECLEYALVTKQKDGIWGGLTAKERDRLKRKKYRERSG